MTASSVFLLLLVLVCPLMMLLMMRGGHGHGGGHAGRGGHPGGHEHDRSTGDSTADCRRRVELDRLIEERERSEERELEPTGWWRR